MIKLTNLILEEMTPQQYQRKGMPFKGKTTINENINDFKYIGYHCSNNPNLDKSTACVNLGQNDNYEWHGEILESIKKKYPEAKKYIELNKNGDTGFRGDDTTKVSNFISKIGICGVFIDEEKPNKRWGKYCYKVYFENVEFKRIHDFIMADEGEKRCFLYLYKNSKPIFKKINSSLEERLNLFLEKNTPTDPTKWAYYKSQAKKKFDVYPSAYANGWAAKKYKAAGGGWKKSK